MIILVLLLAVGAFANQCPTWFNHPQEEKSNECDCGSSLDGVVLCNNVTHEVGILDCYCMTSNGDSGNNTTVVGKSVFNCGNQSTPSINVVVHDRIYHPISPNITELDDKSCGYLNRKGRLCGECKDNFSVPAYSYSFQCIECSDHETSWLKYIAIAFIPLTGFYFLIIIFSVSVTSPKFKSFFYCAQFIASAQYVRIILLALDSYPSIDALVKTIFTMYGFWNLDFFRTIIKPPCLKISTLHVLTLDYVVAGYPLFLVAVTYLLITIYDRDYPLIIKMWQPFQKFFIRFKRQWNLKTSIISTFATFILLSNVKLLSVSFDLLAPTTAYNVKGERVGVYLYYDPSVEYMGKDHRPFAIMAIIILIVTILLPLILFILYPMIWFQKCLNHCHLNSQTLRVFMECFQGYYRNRTEEGREYRYISAMFFISRPLLFIFYAVTLSAVFFVFAFIIFTVIGTLNLISQPYKKEFSVYNKVEGSMILVLGLHNGGMTLIIISNIFNDHVFAVLGLLILIVTAIIPLVYIFAITLHWIYSRKHIPWQVMRNRFCQPLPYQYYDSTSDNDQNQPLDSIHHNNYKATLHKEH